MTPQEFALECLRILRYRLVDMAEDLEDTSDGAGVRLTEKWCMERARQMGTVFATVTPTRLVGDLDMLASYLERLGHLVPGYLEGVAPRLRRHIAAMSPDEQTPVGYALAIERPPADEDDDRIT